MPDITAECEHKWVWLRNEGPKEVGYRKWVTVDRFFCEKCLKQQTVEIDKEEQQRHGW